MYVLLVISDVYIGYPKPEFRVFGSAVEKWVYTAIFFAKKWQEMTKNHVQLAF